MKIEAKIALLIAASSAVACAPLSVKEITGDKNGYMEKLAASSMPSDIQNQMKKKDERGRAFQKVNLKYEVTSTERNPKANEKPTKITQITGEYSDAGNGLIKQIDEFAEDGFPYLQVYSLAYRGIFKPVFQAVPLRLTMAGPVRQIKALKNMDPVPAMPAENSQYQYHIELANEAQMVKFDDFKYVCKTGTYYPANKINAALSGKAIDFDCDVTANNSLQYKSRNAYLIEYGFLVSVEQSNPSSVSTYKLTAWASK